MHQPYTLIQLHIQVVMISPELQKKLAVVENHFKGKVIVVAFSGGVDSSVIAKMAQLYAKRALLFTGDSPTVPPGELDDAKQIAEEITVEHIIQPTCEMENDDFVKNPQNRCFFCKSELSNKIIEYATSIDADLMVEGTNYSDVISKDHRPGHQAMVDKGFFSPLIAAKITKDEIRQLAREWDLSVAEKPSMACLSSRFPYGVEITQEKLIRVGNAEKFLKSQFGILILRVRDHEGLARIEIAPDELQKILSPLQMAQIHEKFKELGYSYVTLDLKGYRSGSLNEVIKYL